MCIHVHLSSKEQFQSDRSKIAFVLDSMTEAVADDKPLKKIAESFEELANVVNWNGDIEVAAFARACGVIPLLIGCLGKAFKFAEREFVAKVDDLLEASKSIQTLPSMIEQDIQANCVRTDGSHTRNLLRMKRAVHVVKALFEQIMITDGNSLKKPSFKAYSEVFAPYHGWALRKAVAAGIYAIPTRQQLMRKLNVEDEQSARVQMQKYVTTSTPVIQYIDELFLSRGLGIDW